MGKKILLADDSITIQKVIELTFSDEDFEVVTVGNGRLAIEKAQETRPDVVLCDIIMPEKDGYEVCEFIKGQPSLAGVPVLLLTGAFEPFDQERADKVGADGFLAKPFEPQTLVAKVKALLSGASSRPAVAAPAAPVAEEDELPEEAGLGEPAPPVPEAASPVTFADAVDDEEPAVSHELAEAAEAVGSDDEEEVASFATAEEALPAGDDMLPAEEATPSVDEDFFTAESESAAPEVDAAAPEEEMAALSADEEASLAPPAEEAVVPPVAEPRFEEVDEPPAPVAAPEDEFSEDFEAVPPARPEPPPATVELSLEERARASSPSPTEAAPAFDEAPDVAGDEAAQAAAWAGDDAPGEEESHAAAPIGEAEFDALDEGGPAEASPTEEMSAPELPSEPEPFAAEPEPEPEPEMEMGEAAAAAEAAVEDAGSFADVAPSEPEPEPSQAAQVAVPPDMVAQIAQRVVAQISDKVIREIAWEVIPDLAEALIKKEIERLREEQQKL